MDKLNLNFELEMASERSEFLKDYLKDKNLSATNLETCANYLLFGKDEDGKNPVQRKELQIQTKRKTWDKNKAESLNSLMENPAFNEGVTKPLTEVPTLVRRSVFSRKEALEKTSDNPSLNELFKKLFRQIDETELFINFYEISKGKRDKDPREELLNRFTPEEAEKIRVAALCATQKAYLLKRHELVELRKQQYTLKDSYKTQILRHTFPTYQKPTLSAKFGVEIPVFPIGVLQADTPSSNLIFQPLETLMESSSSLREEELSQISKISWGIKKREEEKEFFDFRKPEHIYLLFSLLEEFSNEESGAPLGDRLDSTTKALFDTLGFYLREAKLSDLEKEVLKRKIRREKNAQIAATVNKKFGTTHNENYISTIYTQRVMGKIAAAAELHSLILDNIYFEEEFKKCNTCGRTLLLDTLFYTRRARSNDGFSPTCKDCEREKRQSKKVKKEN